MSAGYTAKPNSGPCSWWKPRWGWKKTRSNMAKEIKKPSRAEAENAVRTLIRWAGDDPAREGLLETPKRVAKAFEEYFSGYETDPVKVLSRTFQEICSYDE